MADDIVDRALAAIGTRQWAGPERHPAIERALFQERSSRMQVNRKTFFWGLAGALVAGTALGAAADRMVQHFTGTLVMQDGTQVQFEGDLDENGRGVGTVQLPGGGSAIVELQTTGEQNQVEVQLDGTTSGETTVEMKVEEKK